jgi:RNA polymerase sigma-70 factor (sigma-E family)
MKGAEAALRSWAGMRRGHGRTIPTVMRRDERESLSRAFESHYAGLLRFCVLLCRNPHAGEDLAQETFLRASRKVSLLPDPALPAYLRKAAVNTWRNRLRRRRLELKNRLETPETSTGLEFEDQDILWRAIVSLPARQRAVIVLRYYEDLPETETARLLGCSVGTVKSQASKALRRLKEALG